MRHVTTNLTFSEDLVKARLVSAVVLAAAVSLGTAGCGLITPQATSYEYAPSDGVNVNTGDIRVRNALFIVNDDATTFNLTMTAVNEATEARTLTITLAIDGVRTSKTITLEPGLTQFGNASKGQELIVFTDLDAKAGQTIAAYFQANGADEAEQFVPVLDGTLAEYKPLVVDGE